jgi:hypothetical protein
MKNFFDAWIPEEMRQFHAPILNIKSCNFSVDSGTRVGHDDTEKMMAKGRTLTLKKFDSSLESLEWSLLISRTRHSHFYNDRDWQRFRGCAGIL